MKKTIRVLFGTIILLAMILPATTAKADTDYNPFTDVPELSWVYQPVMFVYENELFRGISDTEFAPYDSMTRGMLVTVLHRYAGLPTPIAANPFTDIEADMWYTEAITWAAEAGIVDGVEEGIFAPDLPISREQLATILFRYLKIDEHQMLGLSAAFEDDAAISDWAKEAMIWATVEGLLVADFNNKLSPKGDAERAEVAYALRQLSHDGNSKLYISNRSTDSENIFTEMPIHTGMPISFDNLLTAVSVEMGNLNFEVEARQQNDDLILTWSENSGFFNSEANTDYLAWRMMDSLVMTIIQNMQVNNVYFELTGGEPFTVAGLVPALFMTNDMAYQLSDYYYALEGIGDIPEPPAMVAEQWISTILFKVAKAAGKTVTVIVPGEVSEVHGEPAMLYAAGTNSADGSKFTAMYHYAITESYKICEMDILTGEYKVLGNIASDKYLIGLLAFDLGHSITETEFLEVDIINGITANIYAGRELEDGAINYQYAVANEGIIYYLDLAQSDSQWILWE